MAIKLQFSLRWIFAAVAVVALLVAEASVFSIQLAVAIGIAVGVLAPAVLTAGIVYTRGFARSFCLGALASLLAARLPFPGTIPGTAMSDFFFLFLSWWPTTVDMGDPRPEYCGTWLLASVGGLLAVAVQWLVLDDSSGERE